MQSNYISKNKKNKKNLNDTSKFDYNCNSNDDIIEKLCNENRGQYKSIYCTNQNDRTIVIGDIHGDIEALKYCLRNCANVIDNDNNWIGGNTRVVICGDMIDRKRRNATIVDEDGRGLGEIKDEEIKIQRFLNILSLKSNGRIIKLLGNHEIEHLNCNARDLNECQDWLSRYSTDFALNNEFNHGLKPINHNISVHKARNRMVNYTPGGKSSNLLLNCGGRIIVQIGDWLFVHGGVLPRLVEEVFDLLNININCTKNRNKLFIEEANKLLVKKYNNTLTVNELYVWNKLTSDYGIVWDRTFGDAVNFTEDKCSLLPALFNLLGFKDFVENGRIVVAHCPQINNGLHTGGNVNILEKNENDTPSAEIFGPNVSVRCNYTTNDLKQNCPRIAGINYEYPDKNGIGRIWRIDVAVSRAFDIIGNICKAKEMNILKDYWNARKPQVMEIKHSNDHKDQVRIFRSKESLPRDETKVNEYLKNNKINYTWNDLKPEM